MNALPRPIILVFVGQYLPGFKAGGILRSVANMVDHLDREFEFRIVTRDRDLGDDAPYPDIRCLEWRAEGRAKVCYLPPVAESLAQLRALVERTPHDLIHLNSFFEPLTIKVLFNRKLGRASGKPIVLSPRGEFAWASLRLKYPKKAIFMALARLLGLYTRVTWHASSAFEADDIAKVMGVRREGIQVALDLPTVSENTPNETAQPNSATEHDSLRIVFLSRISPEKNLDYALRVLGKVRPKVTFDIIGPIENTAYWNECQDLLRQLPAHVEARALGSVKPSEVMKTLAQYDLMLFPSGGENYGHVIAESLTAGTPVLISTNTPWRDLAAKSLGWDLPLNDLAAFVRVVDEMGSESREARMERRRVVKESMKPFLADTSAVESTRRLFNWALGQSERPVWAASL